MKRILWGTMIAATLVFGVGCAETDDTDTSSESADVTAGATRIASSLEGPGNLVIVNGTLVFSTAHFDASGDPELDQQFASWRGQLWKKPLAGGDRKKMADTVGAVTSTAVVGDALLVVDSTYMGVTKFKIPSGDESDFYNDFSHFPDEGEELSTLGGVAAGKTGVYVTRPGSEIMSMKNDGSNVKTFAKTFKSGFIEMAQQIVVLDGAVIWSAEKEGEQGSTFNLYRATTAGTTHTAKKIASYDGRIRDLATDGTHIFVALEKTKDKASRVMMGPADGSKAPVELVSDVAFADNLVFDARFGLFYSDWEDGAMLVDNAAIAKGSAAKPIAVLPVASVTSIAVGAEHLFVADDPGEINEKKGEILRLSLSKIPASK